MKELRTSTGGGPQPGAGQVVHPPPSPPPKSSPGVSLPEPPASGLGWWVLHATFPWRWVLGHLPCPLLPRLVQAPALALLDTPGLEPVGPIGMSSQGPRQSTVPLWVAGGGSPHPGPLIRPVWLPQGGTEKNIACPGGTTGGWGSRGLQEVLGKWFQVPRSPSLGS